MTIRKPLLLVGSLAVLTSGCAMLDNMGFKNPPASSYGDIYEDNYAAESDYNTPPRKASSAIDNERPVQMTPQDSHLQAVKPELNTTAPKKNTSDKRVLLPIESTL